MTTNKPFELRDLPPSPIIHAADAVARWFKEQGVSRWVLGPVCSRDFFAENQKLRAALEKIVAQDYRGNRPVEQQIAVDALKATP